MRGRIWIVVTLVALVAPSRAAAHARGPTVALDYRIAVSPASERIPGLRVAIVDGDRDLRLTVASGHRLLVRGMLGEPMLRFDARGVWASRRSPTAALDRLVPGGRGATGWTRLSTGRRYAWHEHRLAPAGAAGRWSVPIDLDGRRTAIAGTFARAARPALWPWLGGAAALVAVAIGAARGRPRARVELAVALAALAASATLVASATFASADAINRRGRWLEVAAAAVLAAMAFGSLRLRERSLRAWAAMLVGVVAAAMSLGSLGVFRHGVVVSSLPDSAARLATGLALICGAAAGVLGIAVGEERHR